MHGSARLGVPLLTLLRTGSAVGALAQDDAAGLAGTLTVGALAAGGAGPVSVFELPDGGSVVMAWGAMVAVSDEDSTWTILDEGTPRPGEVACWTEETGVTCADASGNETTYHAGTSINDVAIAPDGTVWAVGGYDGDNGGSYRITIE